MMKGIEASRAMMAFLQQVMGFEQVEAAMVLAPEQLLAQLAFALAATVFVPEQVFEHSLLRLAALTV